MENRKNFWLLSLAALLIAAAHIGMILPLRIAIAGNAMVLLFDVLKQVRRYQK